MILLVFLFTQLPEPVALQPLVDATPEGGTLELAALTYLGPVDLNRSIKLQGRGPGSTLISGQQKGPTVVVWAPGADIQIADLSIVDGRTPMGDEPRVVRGRIRVDAAALGAVAARRLSLRNIIVTHNSAEQHLVYLGRMLEVTAEDLEIHHNSGAADRLGSYQSLHADVGTTIDLKNVSIHHNRHERYGLSFFGAYQITIAGLKIFDSDYQNAPSEICQHGILITLAGNLKTPILLEQIDIAPIQNRGKRCPTIKALPPVPIQIKNAPDPVVPKNIELVH